MTTEKTYPNNYRSLMTARREGLLVQSEREFREEQYEVMDRQIKRRQQLYETFYGDRVTQKERNAYYTLVDRKYRGIMQEKTMLYPEQIREKMQYVRSLLTELREMGVNDESIAELMKPERTLSRLYITADCRIFLPEYGNAEVQLCPLPKAVFILFLRHPEGIVLKEMGDYFLELMDIYRIIMGRKFQEAKAKASLALICNPLSNSINEKISRIHEALRHIMDETQAIHYSITGKRSEVRQVMLPQTLICWE